MFKTGMSSSVPRPARKLPRNGEIVKKGYLKKMKTMRKKFFVLRAESPKAPACLEYYDSEKKFERHPNQPKRSIVLQSCFDINRRSDTKYKNVLALYTKNDVFSLVMESAQDLDEWLDSMLFLEHGEDLMEDELLQPKFEYVWQVNMVNRELGGNKNITGRYLLCLTEQFIKLVKSGPNMDTDKLDNVQISIHSIRCCGDYQAYFYIEVGTATVTGPGNLWMQAENHNAAANIHSTILKLCMNHNKKDAPKNVKESGQYNSTNRIRSPSVSEISRPIGINHSSYLHNQPYRTRTNSEGMQPLNHLLRCSILDPNVGIQPHQFYKDVNQAHLLSSPIISPTSDSAGSSLSLDNVDGSSEHHVNDNVRSRHSLNDNYTGAMDSYVVWNAEKRKEDERLNNYLTDNNLSLNNTNNSYHTRKISPNSFKSSSPSQASFLDVHSPCGSSPMEHAPPAYFPMSPVSVCENKNRLVNGSLSVSHSRGSSITEDGYDTGGYMDMEMNKRNNRRLHDTCGSINSPGGSTGSMTSGTPSKDLHFPEYQIDWVTSGGLPTAEEENNEETKDSRQKRAYSVGSRPENLKSKISKNETQDCSRTRAFSVGSKLCPKPRHLPAHSSSQSSVEHGDDMMELDFSQAGRHRARIKQRNEKLGVPPSSSISSAASSYSTAEGSSYLESPRASPRLGSHPDLPPSPPRTSLIHRAFGRSPSKSSLIHGSPPTSVLNHHIQNLGRVPETPPGYVEMRPSCKGELILAWHGSYGTSHNSGILSSARDSFAATTPMSPTGSTTSTLTNLTSYLSPPKNQPFRIKSGTPPKFIDEDEDIYMDMSLPCRTSQASQSDYMEMTPKRKTSLEEDNNNRPDPAKDRSPWTASFRPSSKCGSLEDSRTEDYMNMNIGHKKDRRKTQPITISSSSATSPVSTTRKVSSTTPPKAPMFLPLSNSSLARTTRRKSSLTRRDSRETPTPTIFPFSLSSPAISPAESESPSGNARVSEPLAIVKEVVDANDYVNVAPEAVEKKERGDEYVEMQPPVPTASSLSNIAPPALPTVSQGKTLEKVQKKLVILGLSKTKKNPTPSPPPAEPSPPPTKEITYESLDLESSSSSSSSLASRTFTSYATIDHTKTATASAKQKTAAASCSVSTSDVSSPKKN